MIIMINPGAKIKELRTLARMSQEELGRRVGVQRAAINKYEKGSVTNIPLETVEKIARVFDVSPSDIVGWDKDALHKDLSLEVRVIQGVARFYGADAVDLLETFTTVNSVGKRRIVQYAHDMSRAHTNLNT
jgi:transcriptional regulator with XRE-family HTH domain